jgi:tetratricopeptide (TPR) repeat protein
MICLVACLAVEVAPPPRPVRQPLPLTGLLESVYVPDLCHLRYPVATRSADCQRFCDQGLGYFYSYVWMEAARCFETALRHDPDCAFAWLGLYRAMDKWGKGGQPTANAPLALTGGVAKPNLPDRFAKSPKDYALEMARKLMPAAGHRTQLLVQAKLQERGMWPGTGPDERRKKAQATLDELLTLYEDDEEGWFARAQLADGQHGPAPIYKALLKLNPLHPGANHELVHFYENIRRPALGWPYAEGYMKSSPGIPHAFHMQAHLAMRVGKWKHTTDWSSKAVELEIAYHQTLGVKHGDDHQFFHHLETLTRSLVHDGRFAEARTLKAKAEGTYQYHFRPEWFRMAVATGDWAEARKLADHWAKSDKAAGAYHTAVIALERGDLPAAAAAVDVLRQGLQSKKTRSQELRLWEVQGRLMCLTGQGEAGVRLLKRAVDKTKDDYTHHAWGGGAYYMEQWGAAALDAGRPADAEEAFQEALAHDAGSVRGALGLWALCSRLGRTDEAGRFLALAERCWAKADPRDFYRLRDDFARRAANIPAAAVAAAGD